MGVQFIMYIGIMWKLLFGPYKGKITLSMNLLGTGVTLAPSGLLLGIDVLFLLNY